MIYILGVLSFFISLTSGLNITFPIQPIAATNITYNWTREPSDPQDFFLQKIKIDGDNGPTSPSPPVAVPDLIEQGGQGLIHFNLAGVFQIIAVDTQNPQDKPFFEMLVTVQVNSKTAISNSSNTEGNTQGNNNDRGGNQVNTDPSSSTSATSGSPTTKTEGVSQVSSSKNNSINIILGTILGIVVILVTLGLAVFLIRRRRYKHVRLVESSPDNMKSTMNQNQPASKSDDILAYPVIPATISPFMLNQPVESIPGRKFTIAFNSIRNSRAAGILQHQESRREIQVELSQSTQQHNPDIKEDMRFEEESVGMPPPSYASH